MTNTEELPDTYEDLPVCEIFVSDFVHDATKEKELADFQEDRGVHMGIHFFANHRVEDLRARPSVNEFLSFWGEDFEVAVHESRLLRFAGPLIEAELHVEPHSLLVIDKQTGKFSAAKPQAERLQDRIPVDELNIFELVDGNVTYSRS